MTDKDYLEKAVRIGNQVPAPFNFGAVVVKNGEIVASEHNHVHEMNDPSLHSEVSAIKAACERLGTYDLEGSVLYCSHEPCVMCFSCAAWAHIDRIVYVIPAKEQEDRMYEFRDLDLDTLAKRLVRPMKIEQMSI